jgi:hypothetical protein
MASAGMISVLNFFKNSSVRSKALVSALRFILWYCQYPDYIISNGKANGE